MFLAGVLGEKNREQLHFKDARRVVLKERTAQVKQKLEVIKSTTSLGLKDQAPVTCSDSPYDAKRQTVEPKFRSIDPSRWVTKEGFKT